MKAYPIVPLCLLLLTVFAAVQDKSKQAQLEGLNVTMSLKKGTPAPQQAPWPAEAVTLTVQAVPVNGKTIHELLRDNYIFPDVEAFSIVYALNPQIQKLNDLCVTQLRIPVVQGGAKLTSAFSDGFMVFLTIDKELKEQFGSNIKMLTRLTQAASAFGAAKFQSPADRETAIASLQNISDTLSRINDRLVQRFGRPISTEALNQINAETALLNRMLNSKIPSDALITKSEQDQIAAVEKDINIKKRAYTEVAAGRAPERWPDVFVTVRTLRQGREVPGFRIYYAPEALKGQDSEIQPFGVLSSPTNKTLSTAYYCFWGAMDPAKTAVTNEVCIDLGMNKQEEVHLTIIR
jgi:hypothetical protein